MILTIPHVLFGFASSHTRRGAVLGLVPMLHGC